MNRGINNSTGRKETEGTFYRDVAFVPSGTLAIQQTAIQSTQDSNGTKRNKDAADVRAFYKSVLATPRSVSTKKTAPKNRAAAVSARSIADTSTTRTPSTTLRGHESFPSTKPTRPPKEAPGNVGRSIMRKDFHRNWLNSYVAPEQGSEDGSIVCESCQIKVKVTDLERHNQGTAHLVAKGTTIKPLDTLTLGHSNKGFRMLLKSGWDYEKGLGLEGQGTRHPIATRLKHNRLALGAEKTKKVVTHTFEEIEASRAKPIPESHRRAPLSAEDYRRRAEKERQERINLMAYMKT
ncbi:G patch domain and ankyrin repeat-containing protein 1 [Podila humilis]|nr:G patch domain and ankyrin repeat-containing protein 1 [Podila humilis]